MTESDRPAFAKLLADVLGFYRQDVTAFAMGVWWSVCDRFDIEQVRKALTAHATDPERGQFPPKPADVIRLLDGTHADRSLMAWGKLLEASRVVGAWKSVVFDDPAIHAAVTDMGGWPTVCRMERDALPFEQRRFCDAHRSYTRRGSFEFAPRLVGELEVSNVHSGYPAPPPVLIGDERQARAVLAGGTSGTRTPMVLAENVLRIEAAA